MVETRNKNQKPFPCQCKYLYFFCRTHSENLSPPNFPLASIHEYTHFIPHSINTTPSPYQTLSQRRICKIFCPSFSRYYMGEMQPTQSLHWDNVPLSERQHLSTKQSKDTKMSVSQFP